MRLADFLEVSGLEVANGNRVRDYLVNGLMRGVTISSASCGCDETDEGPYISPADDPAPWFDASREESGEFLGLMAYDVRMDAVAVRSVTPKFSGGGTIGPLTLKPRILSVTGLLLAQSAQGMAYGERWLNDILAQRVTGCAPGTARVLLSCPTGAAVPQYRTLRRIGLVDGPTPGQAEQMPECYIQQVLFQLSAGVPWLISDEQSCMTETVVTGS